MLPPLIQAESIDDGSVCEIGTWLCDVFFPMFTIVIVLKLLLQLKKVRILDRIKNSDVQELV